MGASLLCVLLALPLAASSALAAPGDLDPTFGGDGKVTTDFGVADSAREVVVQPDGKTVVAGNTGGNAAGGNAGTALARYNVDGGLDSSFGAGGKVTAAFGGPSFPLAAVLLQPDGAIVLVGFDEDATGSGRRHVIARYNADGSPDTSFGGGDGMQMTDVLASYALAAALAPDGRIVIAGAARGSAPGVVQQFVVARYNADGSLDSSFSGDGIQTTPIAEQAAARAVAVGPDGKIVAAGSAGEAGAIDFAVARYNSNGELDPSFSGDGKQTTDFGGFDDQANGLVIAPDGRILLAGKFQTGFTQFALARYGVDGELDTSFAGDGKQTLAFGPPLDDVAEGLALQRDGKLVVAGTKNTHTRADAFALARLNDDGSLDPSFSDDGKQTTDFGGYDVGWGLATGPGAKIVVVGDAVPPRAFHSDFAIARYEGEPSPRGGGVGGGTPPAGGSTAPKPPPPATAAFAGCPRLSANVIRGSAAGGRLTGTVRGDRIFGGTGNDVVDGLAGDDCIDLGTGTDRGQGGLGNDLMLGGLGEDRIDGSSGNDALRGGSSADRLNGGFGNDRMHGQSGKDRISGSRGRDRINGGSSNDLISAGSSNDRVAGDQGSDRINGNSGNDSLSGNSGNDRISGSTGADRISGGSGGDRIDLRDGRRDRVNCGSGRDRVVADRADRVAGNCERVRRR